MPPTETSLGRPRVWRRSAYPTGVLEMSFQLTGLRLLREAVKGYARAQYLGDQQAAHLLMVAAELAANAIQHGGGHGRLTVWRRGSHLYCRVVDQGQGPPDTRTGTGPPEPTATRGRGLWMCRQVCADLMIGPGRRGGSMVTAVFDLGPGQPRRAEDRTESTPRTVRVGAADGV